MLKLFAIIAIGLAVLAVGALLVFVYVIQNVEQPEYVLLRQDGDFELRYYPAMTVAEVRREGDRKEALGAGFGPLARYIFAKERDGEKIAMTAPVIQQPSTEGTADGRWSVGFIMPKAAVAAGLPAPASPDVRLTELPPRRVAAVRFSGRTTDERTAEHRERLENWMTAQGQTAIAPPIYAYYNDPMTPGPLRRNEILFEVAEQ
ncbi:heme-binding protein [Thiohalocapsa sp. ML1]|jgi:DNA gyrase inhibitor GyrI|uniref:SOUL family heme-binding protein n=1 Tax=Thiohalocapsa sp. ML1 TaxID=1431688 RepID=UPI00073220DA|nr:heme-binding protein [Thiohalocapsa sp. ML1]